MHLSRGMMRKIGVHYNRDKLDMLLTYELSQSMRHRRYLSVAMLSLVNGSRELVDMLQSDVRRSDSMFVSDKVAIVLMGETNKSGAIKAVNRYCAEFREFFDIRGLVLTSPTVKRERQNVEQGISNVEV